MRVYLCGKEQGSFITVYITLLIFPVAEQLVVSSGRCGVMWCNDQDGVPREMSYCAAMKIKK